MPTLTSTHYFQVEHRADTTPADPNLFSVGDLATALLIDSTAVSTATSKGVSSITAAAPDSASISTASSKATSAAVIGSGADSKATSVSGTTSVADSKVLSVSSNTSIADSKATSIAATTIVPAVGGIPGFLQSGTGAAIRVANTKIGDVVDVRDFGAVGNGSTDDSVAVQAAYTYLNSLGGGTLHVGPQTYLVGDLVGYANITTRGMGWKSKFQKKPGATYLISVNPGTGGTATVTENAANIVFTNLWLAGLSASGFAEFAHLVNMNAVSDVLFDTVKLTAFEGDGVCLGSGNVAGYERHNARVTFRKCYFDGVNKVNRNAITVIDCDQLLVDDCYFTRCTRSDMPGAIDLEPDVLNTWAVLRGIRVRHSRFQDIGGTHGAIGLAATLGQSAMTTPIRDIVIEHCDIDTCGIGIALLQPENKTDAMIANNVVIRNVTIANSARPYELDGVKGVQFIGCSFRDSTAAPVTAFTYACQDIQFVQKTSWLRIDTISGGGAAFHGVDRLTFDDNDFTDCGPVAGGGYAIQFQSGTTTYVAITNNRFRSPNARMAFSVVAASNTYTPATNTNAGNSYFDSVDNGAGRFYPYPPGSVSADHGDASVVLATGTHEEVHRFNTNLTADRTFKLPPLALAYGDTRISVVRVEPVPSAHTVTIEDSGGTPIVVLPVSKVAHAELVGNGSAWKTVSFGTL